jgi:hypothetical protein
MKHIESNSRILEHVKILGGEDEKSRQVNSRVRLNRRYTRPVFVSPLFVDYFD